MVGRVLGNRYEIMEVIGEGGMSIVYKARCRLLKRLVAVKILKHEFINDHEFLDRFNTESQAAASLSHPNIVSVFDVGVEGNDHYIVMEYVEGITLSEYINQNGMLSYHEAVAYAIQICRALDHAHKHHIIHRDIKPHNILMTKEGVLKVTDFGIAHASTGNTVNMNKSTVGSVHYISPEQAKGVFADERSDIYSLGIVLYEMLTAKVPFVGENPVAVALKHIQETPVLPKDINIAIPIVLQNIVMKAISKDPNMRYQSAEEILADLSKLSDAKEGAYQYTPPTYDFDRATKIIPMVADKPSYENKPARLRRFEQEDEPPNNDKKKMKKEDQRAVTLAIITSIVVILVLSFFAVKLLFPDVFKTGTKIEVPNFVGQKLEDIKTNIDEKQFKISETEEFSSDVDAGTIISQDPPAGELAKTPIELKLTVSKGAKDIILPDFVNKEASAAETDITNLSIKFKETQEYSDTPEGYVFNQMPPANSNVKVGSEVTLFISKGKEVKKTTMPNLVGKKQDVAKRDLLSLNLTIGTVTSEASDSPEGTVIFQSVAADTQVDEKAEINMIVSSGTPPQTSKPIKYLTVKIPQDQDVTTIRLLKDGDEIYNKQHKKEEGSVDIKLQGTGTVKIDIYFGSVFQKSQEINFDSN